MEQQVPFHKSIHQGLPFPGKFVFRVLCVRFPGVPRVLEIVGQIVEFFFCEGKERMANAGEERKSVEAYYRALIDLRDSL